MTRTAVVGAVTAVTSGALSLAGGAAPTTDGAARVTPSGLVASTPATTASTPVTLVASVSPVLPEPPPAVDVANLIKVVQASEQQARTAEERMTAETQASREPTTASRATRQVPAQSTPTTKPTPTSTSCGLNTSSLGAVKPWVRDAAVFLGCQFDKPTMGGVAGRGGPSDHPAGLAVDFMVDRNTGDRLAACALKNQDALGIKYVIWKQRINHGSGWTPMEDRGSATANHFDHVHISFTSRAGSGNPVRC